MFLLVDRIFGSILESFCRNFGTKSDPGVSSGHALGRAEGRGHSRGTFGMFWAGFYPIFDVFWSPFGGQNEYFFEFLWGTVLKALQESFWEHFGVLFALILMSFLDFFYYRTVRETK